MDVRPLFVEFYKDSHGHCPFDAWMDTLSAATQARLTKRIIRLSNGLLGDIDPIGDGLSELREHFGAGYRIYVGIRGKHALVLLGSDKSDQERTIYSCKNLVERMEKENVMTPRTLDDFLQDRLQNPEFAAEYLNTFLEDGTSEEIAEAMTAILHARTHAGSKNSFEPVVKQMQEFMHSAGLRWSAQPMG